MPSYAQLEAEPWWRREIVTPELDWLGDELCRRANRPRDAFGSKGNNSHLNGGHRSQEWIKNSDWCTNTSYTAQTGLTETQARHIAACDFTPGSWGTPANRALMVVQTRNLWDAAKRGELAGVRQVFGTLDGKRATGLNVLTGSTTVPDSSHLDHWHLTFDRKALRDMALMRRIADIALTGDDMTPEERAALDNVNYATYALLTDAPTYPAWNDNKLVEPKVPVKNKLHERMNALAADVAELKNRPPVVLTDEQLEKLAVKMAAKLPKLLTSEDVKAILRSEIDAVSYAPRRTGS